MIKKALIFDFDNTLAKNIDITDYDILDIIKGHKKKCNTSKTLQAIRAAHSDFQICVDFIDPADITIAYEEIIEVNMRKVLNALYKPEVIEMVKLLSNNYTLFIVSGRDIRSLKLSIKSIGLDSFFLDIIGDVPYQLPKPHPSILLSLFKNHDLNPDDCIYVGDSYTDFLFAKNANCKFIGAGWYRIDSKLKLTDVCKAPKLLEKRVCKTYAVN